MCGIAGIVGGRDERVTLRRMLGAMVHRGEPAYFAEVADGSGYCVGTNRLAIVDETVGYQPFSSPDERTVCVVNGEIYNYAELRCELEDSYSFRSGCDAEVVLAGFLRWGADMVQRLRGMFAIAVVQATCGIPELWLARDPLGIKPLYWAQTDDGILFASELKAFSDIPMIVSINELRPGHMLHDGAISEYWRCPEFGSAPWLDDGRDALDRTLRETVTVHLPDSTGPVACLLSGGVDSSTVTALVNDLHPGGAEAWTFAAPDSASDDLASAQLVAQHLGIPLHVISPSADALQDSYLRFGVWMTETWEPALVRNAVSYHFLCRGVRADGYKFCLSGEGADEVFGGYAYLDGVPAAHRDGMIRTSLTEVYRTYAQMADRASMYATLEVRVPYLDRYLVEAATGLAAVTRFSDGINKRALRELYPAMLPSRIRSRQKTGMNQGAGFGTNDPGDSIYYDAVRRHYATTPGAEKSDREIVRPLSEHYAVDLRDIEEVYNFARYVAAGFHRLDPGRPRPQLNVSTLRPPSADAFSGLCFDSKWKSAII